MKLGIVGSGMIVHDLFNFIHTIPEIDLIAITSTERSFEKVKDIAVKENIKKTYLNYDMLLEDGDIDTIYLVVPNHMHYEMVKKAINRNKNVICEKPFTSNLNELEELVKLSKKNKLLLLEAISTSYLPNVKKIKEIIPELGDIKIVVANYSQYSSRYNAFKEGNIMPAFDYHKSGGALMDLNIYNICLMVNLFGKPNKIQYLANVEQGIDTSGVITLEYEKFKAVLIGAKDCKAPINTTIQGDKACIFFNTPANNLNSFKVLKNNGDEEEFNLQGDKHRMYFEFIEFERIIREKDFVKAYEMLEISLLVMNISTKARKDANIIFDADK